MDIAENAALVVIDVQQGWDEPENVARGRNNPAAEAKIAALIDTWQATERPVVFVRHTSLTPGSRLAAGLPGNEFQDFVEERRGRGSAAELVLEKNVNSAFIGKPDLAGWLDAAGIRQIVLAGIQTNWCVETTARMGGNLGYEVVVALDATYTFGEAGPDGVELSADELTRATAVNLHAGGFARIARTGEVTAAARR
ncbi:MAG TPA: cysteine hydrolase family protein [Streptomyces sp.]|nr:cysteine hydrolase family protein [Streptomyces sp.]